MSDILPLLLLPAVAGWWLTEWKQRRTRAGLRHAIAQARRPLLHDAGTASVITVARSLETAPRATHRACPWWKVGRARTAWEVRELAAPLGLRLGEVIRPQRDRLGRVVGFTGASRFTGERHGRHVAVTLGADQSSIVIALPNPAALSFAIGADADGALLATGEVPLALEAALHTLTANRRWRGLQIAADGSRVVLDRPASTQGSWLHDLWITEFVADLIAPAPAVARVREAAEELPRGASSALAFGS